MSIDYCHQHDRYFDTDFQVECPLCEDEPVTTKVEDCLVEGLETAWGPYVVILPTGERIKCTSLNTVRDWATASPGRRSNWLASRVNIAARHADNYPTTFDW